MLKGSITNALGLEPAQKIPGAGVLSIKNDTSTLNERDFRIFYEETSRPLFAYLLRVSRDRDFAEDLLQESYCRLLAAKGIPQDGVHRRKYLFRIATNLTRDHWRRDKSRREDSGSGGFLDEAYSADDNDLNIGMRRAFDQLKGRERQLLWLAYVEGSSHQEIADSTGLKQGSIRLLLFRARRRLVGIVDGKTRDSAPKVKK